MSGDYSRKTFDPRAQYNAVRMQQGRVQLDADWNEQSEIQDRRWRAETVDVIGRCGCPDETPDAFRITNNGGNLEIGPGRTYVHGLLAENHGATPLEFNRILAEERGTQPVPFAMQPYLPDANNTLPEDGDTALVYLDVWHREVTYLEDPDLVEIAVGVDTTARQQTVWQVRVLGGVGAIDCATPDAEIPGWLDIITPSGGRLSSEGVGVTDPMDPCLVPPSGGYRALENRLYRLEIHDGGAPGPATFKWSRYNATIATGVTAIPELDTLRVERTMRDDVLRFNAGDWVEITDDNLELNGLPGIIRRVDSVDDGTRTLVLRDDLPAGTFPTNAQDLTEPARHTRVRRWDQSGVVRDTAGNLLADLDDPLSPGVIPVPVDGTSIVLEDGVQVTFGSDAAGAPVRSGDFWCFTARAADGSVEELDNAPPEDIHHHHCRLAISVFDGRRFIGVPSDCRDCFAPLTELDAGCCTEVVQPGQSIQAALDSLPADGGCVCIKTGLHTITEPIRIEGSNIIVHGESPGARIRRENGATVIRIAHPAGALLDEVEVQGLRLEAQVTGRGNEPVIVDIDRCENVTVADCHIGPQEFALVIGVRLGKVSGGRIERCTIGPVTWGIWVDTDSTELDIVDNEIAAEFFDGVDGGAIGIWMEDAFGASRIVRNSVENFASGIYVNNSAFDEVPGSGAHGTQVIDNRVHRAGQFSRGDSPPLFGIDVAARSCRIAGNTVTYEAGAYGGIRLAGAEGCVEKNRLRSRFNGDGEPPIGIQLGFESEEGVRPSERSVVRGNQIFGFQDGIVVMAAEQATIDDNTLAGDEGLGLRTGIAGTGALGTRARGNHIRGAQVGGIFFTDGEGNRASGNTVLEGGGGVGGGSEIDLVLTDNTIEDHTGPGVVVVSVSGPTDVSGNRVVSCGVGASAIGIAAFLVFGNLRVQNNDVLNTGVSADEEQISQPAVGIMAVLVLESLIEGNRVAQTNIFLAARRFDVNDRALQAHGLFEFRVTDNLVIGYPLQILDNNFIGPASVHLVEVSETPLTRNFRFRFERVTFNDNHVWHWLLGEETSSPATTSLVGDRVIVMGNHVKGNRDLAAFDLNNVLGTYVGNIADGGTVNFNEFPTPEGAFNR